MGPRYRLILPEYPPMRDFWVDEDQIVRDEETGLPYPRISIKDLGLMIGLTNAETQNLIYHDLKKIPGISRGQGNTRYLDLHQVEVVIVWLFENKHTFRFDRLYLGLVQVRCMAYLYGYIDRDGLKVYPTIKDMRPYDRMRSDEKSDKNIRAIQRANRRKR